MQVLPKALEALAEYRQFILWTTATRGGKLVKLPVDWRTKATADAHNSEAWLSAEEALAVAHSYGSEFGVGFVFTEGDPFFFVDIDKAYKAGEWSSTATELMALLEGAAVEVSQSGTGLHIIGRGECPAHACKNIPLGLELYTEKRFVALTGDMARGDAGRDMSLLLPYLVDTYYPPKVAVGGTEWTTEPVDGWGGSEDDEELIAKALRARNGSVFGGKANFSDLWTCNIDALAMSYPDPSGDRSYDGSSADAALAQHLAFWTGKNCERISRLMFKSELVRDKWDREDYLIRTITRACSLQEDVYAPGGAVDNSLAEKYGAGKMKAASVAQREYAESVRAGKLAVASEDQRKTLAQASVGAKFYIDNAESTPEELVSMVTPLSEASAAKLSTDGPTLVSGLQYQTATLQLEYFDKCVYVQNAHKIFTPTGAMLKPDQFNATYGGYLFQLDESGEKTTKKAWEAFTESQVIRFPKAVSTCFRPELPTGALVEEEGLILVNTYVPIATEATPGDVSLFTTHLEKVLPQEQDREILLAFMAACVQYKGVKFQWAPLLQGTEGNGKTLFTRCVAYAVGKRYTHLPPASEMSEKFNEWLFGKLFIGIEDVYVADNKREVMEILKPMITNDRLSMRAMQQSQVMGDNRANFMLNSNHKDAIRKTKNDRRFAVFYTAQQNEQDLARDGMHGDYFPDLYNWLNNEGGYAAVNFHLSTYEIPAKYNPATQCHRAPETSSHLEAVTASLGAIEQAILNAIEEERVGFAGGWVSSTALDNLLDDMGRARSVPHNKRREMMQAIDFDWHPALKNGRVNNALPIDGDKKSRLYVRNGHLAGSVGSPAEVAHLYENAQRRACGQNVEEGVTAFGG